MTAVPPGESAAGAADSPDSLDSLGHWRLRPGVAASALAGGLHLRGRDGSVTLEGSAALPALWEVLEEALRTGGAAGLSARAGAGTPVRAALCTLVGQLHAHGMLVAEPGPPEGHPAGDWLLTVADRPDEAAAALDGARVEVRAADPQGALASAAVRALGRAGITAGPAADAAVGGAGRVLVRARRADGSEVAVGAAVHPHGSFVTPVSDPARAGAAAAALAARLGLSGDPDPAPVPAASLTALVAGAAVQRLLCALAGLPDPAAASEAGPGAAEPAAASGRHPGTDGVGVPFVLVAGAGAARAAYRPWAAGSMEAGPPPGTLAEALDGVAALGDPRLGVLAEPLTGALPQLPVALAGCGPLTAGAGRADLARLDAVCRAAELECGAGVVVGAGSGHALGRALRRAALRLPARGPGAARRDPYGSGHPQAHHWWGVLTRRLGVRAQAYVAPLDGGGTAYRADVRAGTGGGGRLLGQAVEATAGDAAAFAALAAVVRVQAGEQAPKPEHITSAGGELCPLAVAGVTPAPWEDERWAAGWWAAVARREAALHTALLGLTGLRTSAWEPSGPGARTVVAALRGCGFTVLGVQDTATEGGER
ncbi:hypothetical protein WDV06_22930 [Streptomyces racemochromogenes]|uniref:Uncharacterized protein n=1 Tax=Streptomyces racemochromogenes TaxID=67353 RepID=A0ABW7PHR6_9ACTN